MGNLGYMRVVAILFCLINILSLQAVSQSAWANDEFKVAAHLNSGFFSNYTYHPTTGTLSHEVTVNGKDVVRQVTSFGAIPNLKDKDITVLLQTDEYLVIRHGIWVSVLDVKTDKPVALNLGPFLSSDAGAERLNQVVRAEDGYTIISFVAEGHVKTTDVVGKKRNYLVLVDPAAGTVGWMPIRSDNSPKRVDMQFVKVDTNTPKDRVILVDATFEVPIEQLTEAEARHINKASAELNAKMLINLHTGNVRRFSGASFISERRQNSVQENQLLDGMRKYDTMMKKFEPVGVTGDEIEDTGHRGDSKPRQIAIAIAQSRIDSARGTESRIRDGMKNIVGQKEAVDSIVRFAQSQELGAAKTPVLVFAGTTGTGKTSGFEAWIRSEFPNSKEPAFILSLAAQKTEEFLATELFGSKPGFIGSDSPTGLMLWMLNNPDGGGILFDEIEKAPIESMNVLLSFLEKGEVKISPQLVKSLVGKYSKVSKEEWPKALYDHTNGGETDSVEIILKLTPKHRIVLATNLGAESFNGSTGSGVSGRRLESVEELRAANKNFNADKVKRAFRAMGYKDELINRVSSYVLFKVIMPEDHALIVDKQMTDIAKRFSAQFRVKLNFSDTAKKFYESETYSPLDGARLVINQLDQWLNQKVSEALVNGVVRPGDAITVDIHKGDLSTPPKLQLLSGGKSVVDYTVGKPLPPSPRALLERAREHLMPTLKRRIIGHEEALQRVHNAIVSQLVEAVHNPLKQGKPIVLYFDGTPGIGKTEIAKAIAEALFSDPKTLLSIRMNEITTDLDFEEKFVKTMTAQVKTGPEALVALLDEIPRAGDNTAYKKIIQNKLLSIFDEGILPPLNDDYRMIGQVRVKNSEETRLPAASVFLCTGNLATKAIKGFRVGMSNAELQAAVRMLERHPESLWAEYEKEFIDAFRSRMGRPILFSPLSDEALGKLRDLRFDAEMGIIKKYGITPVLADSAKEFFITNVDPSEGGRWINRTLTDMIKAPLNTMIDADREKFEDSTIEIFYDKAAAEMKAKVTKDGKPVDVLKLASVKAMKTSYLPEVRNKEAWRTAVHEAGHAIVRRALYGAGSVAEINAFGENGWMEKGFDIPTQMMHITTKQGPYDLAVGLAGHKAEEIFYGTEQGTDEGASSDYEMVRKVAEIMILHGSTLGLAPLPLITNPTTKEVEMSERTKMDLEDKQKALMEFAARLCLHVIRQNPELLMDVAKAIYDNPDKHLDKQGFEKLVTGRIMAPTEKIIRKLATSDPATRKVCENLLLKPEGLQEAKKSWWTRFVNWFWGRS